MQIKLILSERFCTRIRFQTEFNHTINIVYISIQLILTTVNRISTIYRGDTKVVFYWDQPFLVGWVVSCSIWEKPFSVCLVNELFQPASNQVETVEKALVRDYVASL